MQKERLIGYLEIFHAGEQYAATSRELESAFDVKGAALRKQINVLRREGVPIASGDNGYYGRRTAERQRSVCKN